MISYYMLSHTMPRRARGASVGLVDLDRWVREVVCAGPSLRQS